MEKGKALCAVVLGVVLGFAMPGFGELLDIAPHNVLPGGAVVDVNGNTWTVTYSSIFDTYTATSLWDGYIGDQQHLVPGSLGGGWLSANVAGPASIYIDMGTSYTVQQIKLWNFGGTTGTTGGFKDVKIYLGDTANPTTEVGASTLPQGQAVGGQPYRNYTPEGVINLTPGASGRYLTITGLNNYGWGELKGLSEIAVLVPETAVDIAPHNVVPPDGPIVDAYGQTWTVTYSTIFDSYTDTSLWDGYYGDQQHLVPGSLGGGWLSANVAGPAEIYIDMGTSYSVQRIKLWNFGGTASTIGGFKDVKIYLGDTANPTTEVGSSTLPQGQAVNGQPYLNYTPEGVITLPPGSSGRYLTISGLNNYGWDELKGLSEVGVYVIPVPDNSIDIAPHNVIPGGNIVDIYNQTWAVTYSSIFDSYTATSLWDGYYGDQQHLVPGSLGGGWLSANVAGPAEIYIDMGFSHNVRRVKLWNFGGTSGTTGGFKDVKIYLGDTANPTTEVGSGTLPQGQAVDGQPYLNYAPEGNITLLAGATGRYLTISGLTNYGWGDLKGLSEVGVYVDPPESVDASTFGYDPDDATDALQSAINTHAAVVNVPNMGDDWIVRPIDLVSDQEIVFAPGVNVVAKRGDFLLGNDCLFTGWDLTGVKLTGSNTMFKMWKEDYVSLVTAGGGWLSGNVAGPSDIKIDMGVSYTVEQVKLWNTGGVNTANWSTKDVKIYLSDTPNPTTEVGSGALAAGQTANAVPYTNYSPEGVINLTPSASGRYLTVSCLNNQTGTSDFKGLSEIAVVVSGADIAPHNVDPPDGPIVDTNGRTWTVTYSSIFDGFTDTSLWDGYYGDQQHATPAQWRHGINLRGCTDVTISGITVKETGGDGVYLGAGATNPIGSNIVLQNVVCDANYRNGMSVTSADNLTVDNCTFRVTSGTAPECGIDFEPNTADEVLSDITVKNSIFESNVASGLIIETSNLATPSDYSIGVENCTFYGNNSNGIRTVYSSPQLGILDCLFVGNAGYGVLNADTSSVTVTYSAFWGNGSGTTYGPVTLGAGCLTAVQPLFTSTDPANAGYMYLSTGCPSAITQGASDAGFMGARPVGSGPVTNTLVVTPSSRSVAATVGSTTFAVSNPTGSGMAWTAAVSGGSWLSITSGGSGTDAGTITVGFVANPNSSSRTGTIRVTAAGATGSPVDVTVEQAGATYLPGDANRDGQVGLQDLSALATYYGQSNLTGDTWAMGDFNDDKAVNLQDLSALATYYGQSGGGADFQRDYAKAFGTTVAKDAEDESASQAGLICGTVGLPLIAGLFLACLGLGVRMKE